MDTINVIIIDDMAFERTLFNEEFKKYNIEILATFSDYTSFFDRYKEFEAPNTPEKKEGKVDFVLIDKTLNDFTSYSGMDILKRLAEENYNAQKVILTGEVACLRNIIEAKLLGADGYTLKQDPSAIAKFLKEDFRRGLFSIEKNTTQTILNKFFNRNIPFDLMNLIISENTQNKINLSDVAVFLNFVPGKNINEEQKQKIEQDFEILLKTQRLKNDFFFYKNIEYQNFFIDYSEKNVKYLKTLLFFALDIPTELIVEKLFFDEAILNFIDYYKRNLINSCDEKTSEKIQNSKINYQLYKEKIENCINKTAKKNFIKTINNFFDQRKKQLVSLFGLDTNSRYGKNVILDSFIRKYLNNTRK